MQHLGARKPALLGQREGDRHHRRGRVDHRAQMGVVIVQQVAGDRIDETRRHRVEPAALAIDRRHGCGADLAHDRQRGLHRGVARRAECAADMVQHGADGGKAQARPDRLPAAVGHEFAERLGGGAFPHTGMSPGGFSAVKTKEERVSFTPGMRSSAFSANSA